MDMDTWSIDELNKIAEADDLHISPLFNRQIQPAASSSKRYSKRSGL